MNLSDPSASSVSSTSSSLHVWQMFATKLNLCCYFTRRVSVSQNTHTLRGNQTKIAAHFVLKPVLLSSSSSSFSAGCLALCSSVFAPSVCCVFPLLWSMETSSWTTVLSQAAVQSPHTCLTAVSTLVQSVCPDQDLACHLQQAWKDCS